MMNSSKKFSFFGIRMHSMSVAEMTTYILNHYREISGVVGFRDLSSSVRMADSDALKRVANSAIINLPDGWPLALWGNMSGVRTVRASGPDVMDRILRQSPSDIRHYFFGGLEQSADIIREKYTLINPSLNIVGISTPSFSEIDDQYVKDSLTDIQQAKPHIIWVGISSPRQDVWAYYANSTHPSIYLPVGAAFDFLSGRRRRAPKAIQKLGLEWAYRIITNPRRLSTRYASTIITLLKLTIRVKKNE